MAAVVLTLLVLLFLPFRGEAGELCRACHPSHHAERGGCTACHRGNGATQRKEVAHSGLLAGRHVRFTLGEGAEVRRGRELVQRFGCRRCHVTGGRGNRLAANLDESVRGMGSRQVVAALKSPAAAMPDFRLDAGEVDLLATALYAGAGQKKAPAGTPLVIHFRQEPSRETDPFSRRCGACHQLVSHSFGALGRGSFGPNLSGLFSPYYPATANDGRPWNRAKLASWLHNPRSLRPWSAMRPVAVSAAELQQLVKILSVPPADGAFRTP